MAIAERELQSITKLRSDDRSSSDTVCLVIPPSPFLADERVFPFLGVLKVASVLEREGYPVDVLDLSGIRNFPDVVDTYVRSNRSDIFGITSTTPQFPQAVKISEVIKNLNPSSRVILGGAHPTLLGSVCNPFSRLGSIRGKESYEQMKEFFDVVVIGDGEDAVFDAIAPNAPREINAGERKSPYFLKRGTLEKYPLPARHLIDFDSYHYTIDGKDAQSMISQLGCPFECGFCGGRNTDSFRVTRTRNIDSIISEIDELVGRWGKEGIMLYDDELNVSKKPLMEMLEALIKYQEKIGKSLRFRGFVKAELFTQEQADMMYRAGFRDLLSGVESGDGRMLRAMNKHTTPEINSSWIKKCHQAGLRAKALMSIGHPGETEETVANSLNWVLENRPDEVDWAVITPYPGSNYFDRSEPHPQQEGVWVYEDPTMGNLLFSQKVDYSREAEYYKGIPGSYRSHVWTEYLSPERLVELRDTVERVSRKALNLPPIHQVAAMQFDHSMGQSGYLPSNILKGSVTVY